MRVSRMDSKIQRTSLQVYIKDFYILEILYALP